MPGTTDTLKFGLRDVVPPDARAAWGARLIYPDDVLADRTDCIGAAHDRQELLDYLRLHVGERPWERAREMDERRELRSTSSETVTLFEDERCIVRANPNGSGGYLYAAAWLKSEPAASAAEPEGPPPMTNFTPGERVVIEGRRRATFISYGDPRCACPPGHLSTPGMRIVELRMDNGRTEPYWEKRVESVSDNPTLDASGWRGVFHDGYTPQQVEHVLGGLEERLGTALRCVWDRVDDAGCAGDSTLVAVIDGIAHELPMELRQLLSEGQGSGGIDPDTFAQAPCCSEVDLHALCEYRSPFGHNLARADQRGRA